MFWIPSQREAVFVGQESVTIECHSEAFPKSINYWVNSKGAMLQSSKCHYLVIIKQRGGAVVIMIIMMF